MRVVAKLKGLDPQELATLEANAERVEQSADAKRGEEAKALLAAISEERIRRSLEEGQRRNAAKESVKARIKDLELFDRALIAFEEMPPAGWEVAVLKAIAVNPGRDFDFLAEHIGKRGGSYINLAVGSLCSLREHYLGEAPPPRRGGSDKVYSALIIDFTPHREADGSEWHGWTLKPAVQAALQHLGIV